MDEAKGTEMLKEVTDDTQKVRLALSACYLHHLLLLISQETDEHVIASITSLVKENVEILSSTTMSADGEEMATLLPSPPPYWSYMYISLSSPSCYLYSSTGAGRQGGHLCNGQAVGQGGSRCECEEAGLVSKPFEERRAWFLLCVHAHWHTSSPLHVCTHSRNLSSPRRAWVEASLEQRLTQLHAHCTLCRALWTIWTWRTT